MVRKSLSLALAITIGYTSVWGQIQNLDRIIGRVGNSIILNSELSVYYDQSLKNNEYNASITRCKLMQEMMVQQLLVAQAERDSVIVSNEEVEATLDSRINYMIMRNGGSKESLERQQGKTIYQIKEEQRKFFKDRLTAEAMQRKIVSQIKVTPYEVEEFFSTLNTDSLDFIPASLALAEILIEPKASEEMEVYAKENLEGIRKEIVENGKSFSTMATIYSMDPSSKDEGGEYNMEKDNTDPAFFSAAIKLQAGEISPVFRSRYGYHIIQMIRKYSNTRAKIKHILIIPEVTKADYAKAKNLVDSVHNQLKLGKITFEQAISKYSTDEMSRISGGVVTNQERSPKLSMNDLDPATTTAIANLKQGDISEPYFYQNVNNGQQAYRIVMVREQVEPHRLNMKDDYALVQQQALSLKQSEYLFQYVQKIIGDFYIFLDDEFKDCEEFADWKPFVAVKK
jgi:peptidyl-prolyl cis-trans isomerase SurA